MSLGSFDGIYLFQFIVDSSESLSQRKNRDNEELLLKYNRGGGRFSIALTAVAALVRIV